MLLWLLGPVRAHGAVYNCLGIGTRNLKVLCWVVFPIPGAEDEQAPFFLPLGAFSAEAESSLREPPSLDVAIKLINNFHKHGFQTTGVPILIRLEVGPWDVF